MSTNIVLQLHRFLLKECGYKFVLMGSFVQDCLENLFSVVRMLKPVPSACDLKNAIKILSMSQFLKVQKSTGYDIDDSEYGHCFHRILARTARRPR